jgi:hypothetical protein
MRETGQSRNLYTDLLWLGRRTLQRAILFFKRRQRSSVKPERFGAGLQLPGLAKEQDPTHWLNVGN